MSFPKLTSVRSSIVTVAGKKIPIRPWTNRNVLYYENAKDEIQDKINGMGILSVFEKKLMFMQAIFEHLVKPNIEYDGYLTEFEKEVIFINMYKLSRGTMINVTYSCSNPECGGKSENYFNIDTDFKFSDVKLGELKTKDFSFNLKHSSLNLEEFEIKDEDKMLFYYCSFVKDFTYKGNVHPVTDLSEFATWVMDELDENNYNEFISQIATRLPSVELKTVAKCDFCGHTEEFTFIQLPDFSLVTL